MAIPIKAVLTVGTKTFTKGIGVATKSLGFFAGAIKNVTIAFTAFAGVVAAFTLRQVALIDRLGKVSDVIGVNVDTLQKFRFAAEQAGVSTDQADVALRRFSRRLGEAKRGTGELLPALRRLGIDVESSAGRSKNAEAVLLEFADALVDVEDQSQRLALAFKAFDSEGAELVKTLANGSEGLRELFDEAEAFGLVLDREAIAGVEEFNDSLNLLYRTLDSQVKRVIAELAPALMEFSTGLAINIKDAAEAAGGFDQLAKTIKNQVVGVMITFIEVLERLAQIFTVVGRGFMALVRDMMDDPFIGLGEGAREASKEFKELDEQIKAILERESIGTNFITGLMDLVGFGEDAQDTYRNFAAEFNKIFSGSQSDRNKALADIEVLIKRRAELLKQFQGREQSLFGDLPDFSDLIEKLETLITPVEEVNEKIEETVVKGEKMGMTFAKFLDMVFDQNRVTKFYDVVDSENATFMEKIKAAMDLIFGGIKDGVMDFFDRISEKLKAAGVGDAMKTLEDGFVKAVGMFEDSLANAIVQGKADFSALGDHIKQVLAKALVQKFITAPIMGIFGLAKGGTAKGGQPYIVGEEGPELFVPGQTGTVVPNDQLRGSGGMGAATAVTYNINAVDARSFKQLVAQDPEFLFNVTQAGARRVPG
jgi:hypothetical protein